MHWQRELQKYGVHGALSTHPCDEVLLRQRKNFRAPPQVKRMTQKAKTQTVPVLSNRERDSTPLPQDTQTRRAQARGWDPKTDAYSVTTGQDGARQWTERNRMKRERKQTPNFVTR